MIYRSLTDVKVFVDDLKRQGKKIVWTNGCFDILHPWHIESFKKAKEHGDVLIVWLNGDASPYRKTKPWRPIHNEIFRSEMLQAIRYVDVVYLYDEETPITAISLLLPDVLVKGGDYTPQSVVWYQEIIDNGWEIVIIPIVEGYSTTSILDNLRKI